MEKIESELKIKILEGIYKKNIVSYWEKIKIKILKEVLFTYNKLWKKKQSNYIDTHSNDDKNNNNIICVSHNTSACDGKLCFGIST